MCDRRGNVLVDLPFPLEDFLLRQGPGCAARALAWDASGTQLAVLPRAQASVLLWSCDHAELTELTPGQKVCTHLESRPCAAAMCPVARKTVQALSIGRLERQNNRLTVMLHAE